MQLPAYHMLGTGNRILLVDNRDAKAAAPSSDTLQRIAADTPYDQMMWIEAGDANSSARYRVFNADGGEVEQCGNGLRCVAWLLGRDGARQFRLASPAGPVEACLGPDGNIEVSMGAPAFEPERIPFIAEAACNEYPIDVNGEALTVGALSMGNPHVVVRVDDVATAPVDVLGPALQRHPRFPQSVNVGFMQVRSRKAIALRVYERGVGETAACGTGASAAVVHGHRLGLLERDVSVSVAGGELVVSWRGETVWLSGPVELINEGSLEL